MNTPEEQLASEPHAPDEKPQTRTLAHCSRRTLAAINLTIFAGAWILEWVFHQDLGSSALAIAAVFALQAVWDSHTRAMIVMFVALMAGMGLGAQAHTSGTVASNIAFAALRIISLVPRRAATVDAQ